NGDYFQRGGRTSVNFTRTGENNITTTLTMVDQTWITGTVVLPPTAAQGIWKVNVTTIDGGEGSMSNAINVL
ncbi:MAG: hypothetical protein NTW33_10055, partial [Methanoregula sp.]|nr:hypothetical protein [Methanoregula sp.]